MLRPGTASCLAGDVDPQQAAEIRADEPGSRPGAAGHCRRPPARRRTRTLERDCRPGSRPGAVAAASLGAGSVGVFAARTARFGCAPARAPRDHPGVSLAGR